jgi:DNA primase
MSNLALYDKLFGPRKLSSRYANHQHGQLDRSSLPTPIQYLTERGLMPKRHRAESVQIRCPAHKGGQESHPSLVVSLVDGHHKCMACSVKGGDILALHRLITGMSFRDAVADLGGRFHD